MLSRLILVAILTVCQIQNAFGDKHTVDNAKTSSSVTEITEMLSNLKSETEATLRPWDKNTSGILLVKLNDYIPLKLIELERKLETLAIHIEAKFNTTHKLITDLAKHITESNKKLSDKKYSKIKDGTCKCATKPNKPQIHNGQTFYALVEVNETATSTYNQLVKKRDSVEISVSWSTEQNDPCPPDRSRVTFNGHEVWKGKDDDKTASFKITTGGIYQMNVELCNDNGCKSNNAIEVVVADTDGSHLPPLEISMGRNLPFKQTSGKVVGAYFAEWGVYRRSFKVDRVSAPGLTHLMYSFIAICGGDGIKDNAKKTGSSFRILKPSCSGREDFKVTILDTKAALLMARPGLNSRNDPYRGNFGQLMMLKQAHPELKVIASIGGASMGDPFFLFTDKTKRDTFVALVKEFLQTWKFFDGIDIDWEYPGGNGANHNLGSPDDGKVYVQLMKELRAVLNDLSVETGRKFELISAISAAWKKMRIVDYKEAQKYIDHYFVMTYNFKGAWTNNTLGHHTCLYAPAWMPKELHVADYAIKQLLDQGVNSTKIVMGVAMSGRGWTGVHNYTDNPFTGKATGPVNGTWQNGVVDYKDIAKGIAQGKWEYHYDNIAEAPYVFTKETGDLITYDDMRSVTAFAVTDLISKYVKDNKLGGLFAWEIDSDNGDILNAMNTGLGNSL